MCSKSDKERRAFKEGSFDGLMNPSYGVAKKRSGTTRTIRWCQDDGILIGQKKTNAFARVRFLENQNDGSHSFLCIQSECRDLCLFMMDQKNTTMGAYLFLFFFHGTTRHTREGVWFDRFRFRRIERLCGISSKTKNRKPRGRLHASIIIVRQTSGSFPFSVSSLILRCEIRGSFACSHWCIR